MLESRLTSRRVVTLLTVFLLSLSIPVFGNTAPDPFMRAKGQLEQVSMPALKMAIRDLMTTFPDGYPKGETFLQIAERIERQLPALRTALGERDEAAIDRIQRIMTF